MKVPSAAERLHADDVLNAFAERFSGSVMIEHVVGWSCVCRGYTLVGSPLQQYRFSGASGPLCQIEAARELLRLFPDLLDPRIEVDLEHPDGPCVIYHEDTPLARVLEAIPQGWSVRDWSEPAQLPNRRFACPLTRKKNR